MRFTPKNILITGASSGLGGALAKIYAAEDVNLFLLARNSAKLEEVAKECGNLGAKVYIFVADVRDKKMMHDVITEICKYNNIDLIIANAGVSYNSASKYESDVAIETILSTNLNGVLNTILPAITYLKGKGPSQIAIISSMASFLSLASCPAYATSKAAARIWGEAMMAELARDNIFLSVVSPGYIRTPMTEVNKFYMPFLMDANRAATIIKKALTQGKSNIVFPFVMYAISRLISMLPFNIRQKLLSILPKKSNCDI